MTYDTVNARAVLFGGSASSNLDDVWQYDAATDRWIQLEPASGCPADFAPPTGRAESALEYDPINQLFWIFGGSGFGCNGPARTAGTGTTTIAIVDPALTEPTTNFYKDWTVNINDTTVYVSGYDPTSKRLILATPLALATPGSRYFLYPQRGGGTFSYSAVTRSWSSLTGPHWGYTGAQPSNRLSPAMAYSTRDTAIVMFGGQGSNDTWALDAETKSWVQKIPSGIPGSPPNLAQLTNSMVYDSDNDVFILFGGCLCSGDSGPSSGDTWTYGLSTNTWTKMTPAGSPPPRQGHNLVYDSTNKVAILFGGFDAPSGTYFNDLWVYRYATNTWTEVFPSTSPAKRRVGAMVHDPVRHLTVLYGGENHGSLHDVWALHLQGPSTGSRPPALTSISPNSTAAGGPAFTLAVTGANFGTSSVVRWKGDKRPTTYVRSTQLQASIPATDIASVGTAEISVFTPAPGGGTSSPLGFIVTAPAPAPTLTSISPSTTTAGSSALTLTATGANFTGSSVVRVNGSNRPTTVVSATQLNVTILATDMTGPGTLGISVFTPSPGGATSASLILTIVNPTPTSITGTFLGATGEDKVGPVNQTAPNGTPDWHLRLQNVKSDPATVRIDAFVNGVSNGRWVSPFNGTNWIITKTFTAGTLDLWFEPYQTPTSFDVFLTYSGGTSAQVSGIPSGVSAPPPVLTGISPTITATGGAAFTLTVTGTNFSGTSVTQVNGSNRPTTVVSTTQLTATILGSDIAANGALSITVLTPAPGGGTSAARTLTVSSPSAGVQPAPPPSVIPILAENEWGQIGSTALRPTIPKTIGGVPVDAFGSNAHPDEAIMTDWSGGAWAEGIETLFVHGGGHSSSPISNVFAFPLSTRMWRVESPQASAYNINDPLMGDNGLPTNPDGTPASTHAYGNHGYIPVTNEFLRSAGSWSKSGASTGLMWAWSLTNRTWRRTATAPQEYSPTGYPGWHPTYRVMLAVLSGGLWGWDPIADQWLQITATGGNTFPNRGWTVWDSKRNNILAFSGVTGADGTWPGKVAVVNIDKPWPKVQGLTDPAVQHVMSGDVPPEWATNGWPARVNGFYDERRDVIVHWGGNRDIYTMNPVTYVWTKTTGTGVDPGSGLTSQTTGRQIQAHYNRFFRIQGRDLYGLVTDIDANVLLYRPFDSGNPPLLPPPPPADNTPPTASMTSPLSGTTVSGTVTVSANAADNVGVAGVQFKLDGANLGAEITTVPYSVSWNTALSSNASHTLTATARDAAGNSGTAPGVSVTVNNSAPPPPTLITGAFLGVTGEDKVGQDNQTTPNGTPDWHLRVQSVKSDPATVRIDAFVSGTSNGRWVSPFNGTNWIIAKQFASGQLDLWFEPYQTPTTFNVTVTYADGTTDSVTGIASGLSTTAPPPPSLRVDCSSEKGLAGRTDVVFCEPWEDSNWWQNGYVQDGSKTNPKPATASNVAQTSIETTGCVSGKCLKVNMLKGWSGSLGIQWPLAAAGIQPDELYIRYYLKLSSNFDSNACDSSGNVVDEGGKFPGPADVRTNADPVGQCGNGGDPGDGINCWSMRTHFDNCDSAWGLTPCTTKPGATTRLGSYTYFYGQESWWGNVNPWDDNPLRQFTGSGGTCSTTPNNTFGGLGDGGVLLNDRWYNVEMYVKMNTPGQADGVIRAWVDGLLSYEKTNMIFRQPGHDNLHVRAMWLDVYTGGTNGNCKDKNIWLDQMVLATGGRIGPFVP